MSIKRAAESICPECGTVTAGVPARANAFRQRTVVFAILILSFATLASVLSLSPCTTSFGSSRFRVLGAVAKGVTLGELRAVASGQESPQFDYSEVLASPTGTLAVDVQPIQSYEADYFRIGWPEGVVSARMFRFAGIPTSPNYPLRWFWGTIQWGSGTRIWTVSIWPLLLAAAAAILVTAAASMVMKWFLGATSSPRRLAVSVTIGSVVGLALAATPTWSYDYNSGGTIGIGIPLGITARELAHLSSPAARAREIAARIVKALDDGVYTDSELLNAPYVSRETRTSWMAAGMRTRVPLKAPRPDSAIPLLFLHQENDPVTSSQSVFQTPIYKNAAYLTASSNVYPRESAKIRLVDSAESVGLAVHGKSGHAWTLFIARLALSQILAWLLVPTAAIVLFQASRGARARRRIERGACIKCGYDLRGLAPRSS